jgi:hypothetical protein
VTPISETVRAGCAFGILMNQDISHSFVNDSVLLIIHLIEYHQLIETQQRPHAGDMLRRRNRHCPLRADNYSISGSGENI